MVSTKNKWQKQWIITKEFYMETFLCSTKEKKSRPRGFLKSTLLRTNFVIRESQLSTLERTFQGDLSYLPLNDLFEITYELNPLNITCTSISKYFNKVKKAQVRPKKITLYYCWKISIASRNYIETVKKLNCSRRWGIMDVFHLKEISCYFSKNVCLPWWKIYLDFNIL